MVASISFDDRWHTVDSTFLFLDGARGFWWMHGGRYSHYAVVWHTVLVRALAHPLRTYAADLEVYFPMYLFFRIGTQHFHGPACGGSRACVASSVPGVPELVKACDNMSLRFWWLHLTISFDNRGHTVGSTFPFLDGARGSLDARGGTLFCAVVRHAVLVRALAHPLQ